MILGESGEDIHKFMDKPSQLFGKGHRNYLHDPFTVALIGLMKGQQAAQHAILHILTDEIVSKTKKDTRSTIRTDLDNILKKVRE